MKFMPDQMTTYEKQKKKEKKNEEKSISNNSSLNFLMCLYHWNLAQVITTDVDVQSLVGVMFLRISLKIFFPQNNQRESLC